MGAVKSDLLQMKNIGREMARKLAAVGIDSADRLRELGSREAFFQLKEIYPRVCLVHLYALEGAVQGLEFNSLPAATKQELKAYSDWVKETMGY